MLKTYIEWNYAGDHSLVEVPNRNTPVTIPKHAIGYRFMSRTELTVDGEKLVGQYKNHSAMTYFGKELTLAQVQQRPDTKILQANMKANNWTRVVFTEHGRYMPLNKDDVVIAPTYSYDSLSPN